VPLRRPAADEVRRSGGLKRPVKPKRVEVPRPLGPSTARRVHATLRAALNAAVRADEVSRNAAASQRSPALTDAKVRPWEPEQLGEWLDSIADERLYALCHLGAFGGLRRELPQGQGCQAAGQAGRLPSADTGQATDARWSPQRGIQRRP
jgi:hypothetical protein